jgi:predicted nuclease of predicted toxin-antitoxin system
MTVSELMQSMNLQPLNTLFDKEIVASLATDLVSNKIASGQAGGIWVTDRTDVGIVSDAKNLNSAAIIITQGQGISNNVKEAANEAQITIFSTPLPSPDIVGKLYAVGIRIEPYGQVRAVGDPGPYEGEKPRSGYL